MLTHGILLRPRRAGAMENADLRAGGYWATGSILAAGPEWATNAKVRGHTLELRCCSPLVALSTQIFRPTTRTVVRSGPKLYVLLRCVPV
jgi:hypothetical protein